MKKVLRALCVLFAAALTLSLCGCNGTGGTNSGQYDPSSENYFSLDGGATGVEYCEGVMMPQLENPTVTTLMTCDWNYIETNNSEDNPLQQYYATLMWRDLYEGGDVTIVTIPLEQMTDYVSAQTAAGDAPDLIPCQDMTYPTWNAAGLTEELDQFWDALEYDREGLYDHDLTDNYMWAGKHHGLVTSYGSSRNYIVFNKTMFEQMGRKTPLDMWKDGEWNWTNFVKTATEMTTDNTYGFDGWGLQLGGGGIYPMARVNDDGTMELTINDAKYVRYATEIYNLYRVNQAARYGWDAQKWETLMVSGMDAMVMTNLAGLERMARASEKVNGPEFRVAPFPVFDPNGETEPIADGSFWGYSISSAAKNKLGAAAYIRAECLVARNILDKLEGNRYIDHYLTDDEKAAIEEADKAPFCSDPLRGLTGVGDVLSVSGFTSLYDPTTPDISAQASLDQITPPLQAVVDEFNEMAAEAAAQAEANKAETTAAPEG